MDALARKERRERSGAEMVRAEEKEEEREGEVWTERGRAPLLAPLSRRK